MLDERQAGLLTDVLDSARSIRSYLAGVRRESFMGDAEKQDAVLRRFEIIGEAASRLAPESQAQFPSLPFREKHYRARLRRSGSRVGVENRDGRFAGLDRNAGAGFRKRERGGGVKDK
jgi:hypothetical protein